jgi:hypothetical protein
MAIPTEEWEAKIPAELSIVGTPWITLQQDNGVTNKKFAQNQLVFL